ncbi:MAG: ABC transporter substrate-binding protein [Candidatus Rokubacteria bacterium]|nr:ABC transporter substrate-binding protein [Candidatus Rokubacteria bacterium]
MRRRDFVKVTVVGGAATLVGGPYVLRRAYAQNPIKIGLPTVLSGGNAQYGIQAKRACELFGKEINAKGGILGRPVEFIYEDTAADPATAVRKAQKLVEKDGVKILTGTVLSSEALAVSAKCPEWKVILMSTINGAGALTAKSFNRYFFRVNTSGPMGARAVTLYLTESPMKRFFALGSDYAWGRDSVASFTSQMTAAKKDIVAKEYPPVGTKDFASYIGKIKQSRADGVYLVLPGQDATIFLRQAHQFGVTREVKPIMEIVEMENMKAVGDAMEGTIGSSRYPFTVDTPKNHEFVKRFHAMHNAYPDMFDGETYEGLEWIAQVMQKAGTADDVEKIIETWEDSSYDGLEGPFFMRKCDHQAVQPGFAVQAVKDPKYPHLIPKILATYPGDKVTPKCRTEEFA